MQIPAPAPLVHRLVAMIPPALLAKLDAWSSQAAQRKLRSRRQAAKQPRFDFDRAL